jgi:fatty acid desaturase
MQCFNKLLGEAQMKFNPVPVKSTVTKIDWQEFVKKYQAPDIRSSIWQIANSVIPYFVMWYLMYRSLSVSYWLMLLLALAGATGVWLFYIQHQYENTYWQYAPN